MAEDTECFKNKKLSEYKESVQAIGNSWIICRSQSHSGRIYYFNTLTGKSAWNLSNAEIEKAKLLSGEGVSGTHVGDCPEPSEPPVDIAHSFGQQKAQPNDSVARIYNKQIINNQFSKPCINPAFQNSHCHTCTPLNVVNDTGMGATPTPLYNPAMWPIHPPQVLLALANQAQPMFNSPNIPIQNNLPNCYQIGHHSASQNTSHCQGFPKKKSNKYPPRWNQNSQRNLKNNSNNDLRDLLSSRRKDQRSHLEVSEPVENKTHENRGNNYVLTADDLDSSDIDDDWLEANTISDIPCAWKECSGADCWIVVANTRVLLNNRKFLSKFIKAEEQIFLLTPLEVIKQLRSATGADGGSRLVQRARCALRFATQQMDKVPAGLKNLQNRTIEKCCLELIGQNYHVLFLLDENESSQVNINGVSKFTTKQLKELLNQKCNTLKAGGFLLKSENITVTICQNNGENKKTISQSTQEAVTVHHAEDKNELSSKQHKEIEIQTEKIMVDKKTVDASIQTDFEFLQSTQSLQSSVSKNLEPPSVMKPLNTEKPKSPDLEESLNVDQTLKMDAVKSLDENKKESEVATKKIKLNRKNVSRDHSTVKKPQFRWRKQRAKPSLTTSSSPGVVCSNQTVSTKSPPSSLMSISDLLPPENVNFSDFTKIIDFSDASIEKTSETMNKVIEESSLDVISNSIDDEIIPKISKNAILNVSKDNEKEDIVMFEVTSDIMDDYLSRGCDEWLSRFVQIMEEALSQILQQEPSFFDPNMPPPWSVYEAVACIKIKFRENPKLTFACDECGAFLLKISDSKGKIFADLNPSDFMRLYSYGVYLIEALQSLINDSEDLQIAKESLANLLNDIKNPNLDVAQNVFMDTFLTDKQGHTANISELVTDAGDDLVDVANKSPTDKLKQTCEPSPSRYNLRSSQRSNDQNEKGLPDDDTVQNMDTDEPFFTNLRLQKTTSPADIYLGTAAVFSPQQTCLSVSDHSFTGGINENAKENEETEVNGPKIIRNFHLCPRYEENQLKSLNALYGFDSDYDDISNDNNYYGNEFNFEDNCYSNSNDKSDSNMQSEMEDQYCYKSDEIGTHILKFVIDRTTYPVHRVLANLHSFCEATYKELYSQEKMDQLYKTNLTEKTKKVRECLNNLRNHLNSVLCRNDTKTKVRIMLEELGFMNSEINETQVAVYGNRVRKYLDQANILFESVDLIAAAIREKE